MSLLLWTTLPLAIAQLSLPTPAWLPPNVSQAIVSSNNTFPNQRWADLLGESLYFYDAQRSGELPDNFRVDWRNSSALNDGPNEDGSLAGGFYDAGNFIKPIYTLSFTWTNLAWTALQYGRAFDLANQTAYLDSTLRWGLDWMSKCHPEPNVLWVQVGNTDVDNDYWGGDEDIPTPRTCYQVNSTSPGTDSTSATAASFAAAALVYSGNLSFTNYNQSRTIRNTTYATSLLQHAIDLWSFANSSIVDGKGTLYQDSIGEDAADAYLSSRWEDDFAWAGLWLYLATKNTMYYESALQTYYAANLLGSNQVFNWDSVIPGLPLLLSQIQSSRTVLSAKFANSTLAVWTDEAERYFNRIIDDPTGKHKDANGLRSYLTKGGLLYYPDDSATESLNPALNIAVLMLRYAPFASSSELSDKYRDFATSQIDYLTGKNPMNAVYIVGLHNNSPQNPHSAMASGGNNLSAIDTDPVETRYTLYGAVVGGPDEKDRFFDIRSDWPETEIALDYNAPLVAIAAYSVLNNPNDPFYVQLDTDDEERVQPPGKPTDEANPGPSESGAGGLSDAAIIAIAIISASAVFILGLAIWPRSRRAIMNLFRCR